MISVKKMPLLEAPGEFKAVAEGGRIHAVGRLNGVGQHVEIPSMYWLSATLNMSTSENKPQRGHPGSTKTRYPVLY